MTGNEKPPGEEDDGYPLDVDIIAMTMRHGADYTKRYLNSLALERAARGIGDDT